MIYSPLFWAFLHRFSSKKPYSRKHSAFQNIQKQKNTVTGRVTAFFVCFSGKFFLLFFSRKNRSRLLLSDHRRTDCPGSCRPSHPQYVHTASICRFYRCAGCLLFSTLSFSLLFYLSVISEYLEETQSFLFLYSTWYQNTSRSSLSFLSRYFIFVPFLTDITFL